MILEFDEIRIKELDIHAARDFAYNFGLRTHTEDNTILIVGESDNLWRLFVQIRDLIGILLQRERLDTEEFNLHIY